MNFTGLSFILVLFYFFVLIQTCPSSDSLDLEVGKEKSEFKNDYVDAGIDAGVVNEIKVETTGIRRLESALLGHIGSFMNAPHRELGRLTKYIQVVFKKNYPYRRFVSEHFGITELVSAVCDTDLYWFSDMIECYKNDPNHFFVQLTYAIFFDEKFSVNARFLCQYFLRVYKNFNLESVHLLISPNINGSELLVKIAYFLHKNQLFDLMIPLFLNDHNLYVRTLRGVSNDFGFLFNNELISNSYRNGHGDGIKNFFELFELRKTNFFYVYTLKNILLADEAEEILFNYLETLEGIEAKSNVIRPVIDLFFYDFCAFYGIKFHDLDFDKIFKRISRIIIKASTDELIDSHYLQKFQILNEFFFGPNTEKFDLVLIEKYYEFDLFTSSIFLNRKDLFSKLLNLPDFYNHLQGQSFYFIKNLSFFFEFYEKYPEKNFRLFFCRKLFKNLMKFYKLKDFDFSNPEILCHLILELKPQHLNNNLTSNFPRSFNFNYYYSNYYLYSSFLSFNCVLKYYSGSNKESLLLFLQKMKSACKDEFDTYYFSLSDEIFKILSISETLRNNFLSELRLGIKLTMKQLMRLINNQGVPVQILKLLRIDYLTSNISCLESDSDFKNLEELTGKSVLDIVLESFEKYPRDLHEPLKVFVRVRKVLHYFLRNNARAEISKFDPRLIELFRKEAPIVTDAFLHPQLQIMNPMICCVS